MKLNLINVVAGDKEIVISYDYQKQKYELGILDLKTLELNIVER